MKIRTRFAASIALTVFTAGHAMADVCGVVVLDPTASSALSMSGGARIEAPEVYVNSTSPRAITASGNGVLASENTYFVGGCNLNGGFRCAGTMTRAAIPYIDPCANLVAPNPASLEDRSQVSWSGASVTLYPGNYSKGIKITSGVHVTFLPGIYSIGGSGLSVTSGTIDGQGVTLVIEKGGVSISGNSTMHLTPPSTGRTAGAVIILPTWNNAEVSMAGGSGTTIVGSIYAPSSTIKLVGGGSVTADAPIMGSLVVGRKVELSGQGVIRICAATTQQVSQIPTDPQPVIQPDPEVPVTPPVPQAQPAVPLPSQPLAD